MPVLPTRRPWTALLTTLGLMGWFLATATHAQAPVTGSTLDDVRRELSPGDVISIVQTTGDPVRGRVLRVGTRDLDIRPDAEWVGGDKRQRLDLTIPLSAIQSLDRRHDSAQNGILIGAGVGAGVGLTFFIHAAAIDANEMDEWAAGYIAGACILTGIGALVGWAIDAAHSKPHLHYEAPTTVQPTVRASAVLSRVPGSSCRCRSETTQSPACRTPSRAMTAYRHLNCV